MSNRMIVAVIAASLWLAASESLAQTEPTLLEGFETISVVSSNGEVSAVKAGQGVTQGNVAAQLGPDASVSVSVGGAAFGSAGWLKVDTLTAQILPQSLKIDVRIGRHGRDRHAWAKGGTDTVALPVSVVRRTVPARDRLGQVKITITNTGDSPLILDNVRLEKPAEPPAGAVLLDCGRGDQSVWPGFTPADRANQYMVWSGEAPVYEYEAPYPDPLGRDFVGRPPSTKVLDYFALSGPGGKAAAVWIWATHYASRAETQPTEYVMKVGGRTVLQRRRSTRDMLTDRGLLLGKDGKWTPKWFNEKLAPSFVDCVQTQIPDGKTRVDVGNCQIAAIAMAPASSKLAMARYVKQVKDELSRYRRQFVVGARHDPICSVDPTAKEAEQGFMLFEADPDRLYDGRWKPDAARRITTPQVDVHAGGTAVFELAVVPLKQSVLSGASFRNFTEKESSTALSTVRGGMHVWAVNRIPRVRQATVEFVPYVLDRRSDPLKTREIQIVIATVKIAPGALPGTYEGELQLSLGREPVTVPARIRVHPHEGKFKGPYTCGVDGAFDVGNVYSTMASVFSDAQQDVLTKKLRQEVFDLGINSMVIGGVRPWGQSTVRTGGLVGTLKSSPLRDMDGAPVVSVGRFYQRLSWQSVQPASARHRAFSNLLVTEIHKVFRKTTLSTPLLMVGSIRHGRGWGACLMRAQQIGAHGGKPLLRIHAESLKGANVAKAEKAFAAWTVVPDAGNIAPKLAAFKKLGKGRRVYLDYHRIDRYLCGFYAAGMDADGVFVGGLFFSGGTAYSGDGVDGRGLLVPAERGVGNFKPTINAIHLARGRDDYVLVRRCENLLEKAAKGRVAAAELEQALGALRDAVTRHGGLGYDSIDMRTSNVPPSKLQTLRIGLVQAAAAVSNRLKGRD